jgi:hypothetical protein
LSGSNRHNTSGALFPPFWSSSTLTHLRISDGRLFNTSLQLHESTLWEMPSLVEVFLNLPQMVGSLPCVKLGASQNMQLRTLSLSDAKAVGGSLCSELRALSELVIILILIFLLVCRFCKLAFKDSLTLRADVSPPHQRSLDLSNTDVGGPLPNQLTLLTNLNQLLLDSSNIAGTIPTGLTTLTRLSASSTAVGPANGFLW